jgi:hypothetical protein
MVRGIPKLKPGPAVTAYRGHRFLYPGEPLVISLGGRSLMFRAFGTVVPNHGGALYQNYGIRMTDGDTRLELVFELDRVSDDGAPHIIWAGDLDRDNKIDLFAELRADYYGSFKALFLSTASEGRAAPIRVAALGTDGC